MRSQDIANMNLKFIFGVMWGLVAHYQLIKLVFTGMLFLSLSSL
jgi:hypothetical protein